MSPIFKEEKDVKVNHDGIHLWTCKAEAGRLFQVYRVCTARPCFSRHSHKYECMCMHTHPHTYTQNIWEHDFIRKYQYLCLKNIGVNFCTPPTKITSREFLHVGNEEIIVSKRKVLHNSLSSDD